jgi:tetratricopeptide (TPR) repeat protein
LTIGSYRAAANNFSEAARQYETGNLWEAAAGALFNQSICLVGISPLHRKEALLALQRCRDLARSHDLAGPTAYNQIARGLIALEDGDLHESLKLHRTGLSKLPPTEQSYRRMDILIQLTVIALRLGHIALARRYMNESEKVFRVHGICLYQPHHIAAQGALLFEEGKIEQATLLLTKAVEPLFHRGVQTLSELALAAVYISQRAAVIPKQWLNCRAFSVNPVLHGGSTWWQYQIALGDMALADDRISDATSIFHTVISGSSDLYHRAKAEIHLSKIFLRRKEATKSAELARNASETLSKIGPTTLQTTLQCLKAGIAYQAGDFTLTEQLVKRGLRSSKMSFTDHLALKTWLATIDGRSPKLVFSHHINLISLQTKQNFSPTLRYLGHSTFLVSDHYKVDLSRLPSLRDILLFLLSKSNHHATYAELQQSVWKESIHAQGWQQKIRNAVVRLRDHFPFTLAPIILQSDGIALFTDAIHIEHLDVPITRHKLDPNVLQLLKQRVYTSSELSAQLHLSPATTKRLLKRLTENQQVRSIRKGRHVYYETL